MSAITFVTVLVVLATGMAQGMPAANRNGSVEVDEKKIVVDVDGGNNSNVGGNSEDAIPSVHRILNETLNEFLVLSSTWANVTLEVSQGKLKTKRAELHAKLTFQVDEVTDVKELEVTLINKGQWNRMVARPMEAEAAGDKRVKRAGNANGEEGVVVKTICDKEVTFVCNGVFEETEKTKSQEECLTIDTICIATFLPQGICDTVT